jgi:FAD/FMN-containing dehydrogenase
MPESKGAFRRVAIARLAAIFSEYEVCDFGHIADGDVHFNLVRRPGADYHPVRAVALHDRVLDIAVRDFGGGFSGEHGIGRANQTAYDQFTPALVQRYSATGCRGLRRCAGRRGSAMARRVV